MDNFTGGLYGFMGASFALIIFYGVFLGGFSGEPNIVVTHDFYEDWNNTKMELKHCQEQIKDFECPPVECKPGASGVTFAIFGFIMYMASLATFFWTQNKYADKVKKRKK